MCGPVAEARGAGRSTRAFSRERFPAALAAFAALAAALSSLPSRASAASAASTASACRLRASADAGGQSSAA